MEGAYSREALIQMYKKVRFAVLAKFKAFTKELRIARILQKDLNGQAIKYNHFEFKNIFFHENKLPVLS